MNQHEPTWTNQSLDWFKGKSTKWSFWAFLSIFQKKNTPLNQINQQSNSSVFWMPFLCHSWLVSLMAQRPHGWVSATRYTCVSTKPQHSQEETDKRLNNYILQPLKSWKSMDKSKTWKIWQKHDETSSNYHPGFTNSLCFLAYETTASCGCWSFI